MKNFNLLALAAVAAIVPASTAIPAAASDVPTVVRQTTPAIYRFALGEAQITALSDGSVPVDVHSLLRGASSHQIDELLTRSFLADPVETSINAYLIELDGRRILVDVGAGDLFGPGNGGRLPAALAAAGVAPETITDILITHVHTDHSGGLVRAGEMIFPNANVHAGGPDVRFFLDGSNATRPDYDERYWLETSITLKPYFDAGRVVSFDEKSEILPGIRAELNPGHTPGSAFYTLTSRGQSIVFIGDVIHVGAIQFPEPDVTITFDLDQDEARAARKQAFARFARERTLLAAPHLPFPGVGHISVDGAGYQWFPVEQGDRDGGAEPLKL
jgi:glyoxylase-like metal-dependent hydrolase (beta-lactamase superfamily II)